jgi:hypothetical protein
MDNVHPEIFNRATAAGNKAGSHLPATSKAGINRDGKEQARDAWHTQLRKLKSWDRMDGRGDIMKNEIL